MLKQYVYSIGKQIPPIKRLVNERDNLRRQCIDQEQKLTGIINTLQQSRQNLENENATLCGEINEINRDTGYQWHKKLRNGKIVVYTAIYGDKDELKEIPVVPEGCSLVCFTDNKYLKSRNFDVRFFPAPHPDPVRCARFFKVLPHVFFCDYEYSLWVDGSIIFKRVDIQSLIDNYLREHNWACFIHPERDCIYDEADICSERRQDNVEIMRQQVEQYRSEGYPPHHGLNETGVLLRRHLAKDVIRFDEDWWAQILKFSRRDQLSFNYVAWKNNFRWASIKRTLWDNEYFSVQPHKH